MTFTGNVDLSSWGVGLLVSRYTSWESNGDKRRSIVFQVALGPLHVEVWL
jgi:hypothetical protein